MQLPLHSYQLRSLPASSARLVNCFPEQLPAGAKTPVIITRSPGVKAWTTAGSGPIRGLFSASVEFSSGRKDYAYAVSGSEWYHIDSSGTATLIGDIGTANVIDMESNADSVIVVNQPRAYYFDGSTFGEITDDDFVSRGASDVEFLDNFLLFREPDSSRFFGADVGSVTSFNALQFAIADSAPDELVAILAAYGMLIAFGTKTIELYENTGASFPFERIINGTIELGCLGGVAKAFNIVFWVADDFTVRRLEGTSPVRISTHAIEQKLSSETVLSADAYDQEGHFFYALTTSGGTYLYDVVTGEWSERETYGKTNWNARYHTQFSGKELVGDWESNKIGELDPNTYTDWGSTQRMEWTYQPVYAEARRAFHDRLEIVLETGVGLTTGQGSEPKIMLQKSDDGGKSWQALPDKTFGKRGETRSRAVWFNLGSARQRVYRAAVSDPVPVTVSDTVLEVRGGRL